MDIPELPPDWEKKALIVVGVVFVFTIIYSFNPFQSTNNNNTIDPAPDQSLDPVPFAKVNKTNNTTNSSAINGTFKITADQAKKIALQSRPAYSPGQPIQGNVVVNSTNYAVWIVPLSQNNAVAKTIYIDANTGIIVLEI